MKWGGRWDGAYTYPAVLLLPTLPSYPTSSIAMHYLTLPALVHTDDNTMGPATASSRELPLLGTWHSVMIGKVRHER